MLLLLAIIAAIVVESSFVLQIAEDDEQCFVIRAPPKSLIRGNFDVLDDNLSADPVVVKIFDGDSMEVLYESKRSQSEDIFQVPVTTGGRFYICVQNGVDHDSEDELDRKVGLEVRVSPLPSQDGGAQSLLVAAEELQEKLKNLQNHHDYMRDREAAHRETTELTYTNVVRWSLLEFFVLLGIAVSQIVVLRVFFEKRRYVWDWV